MEFQKWLKESKYRNSDIQSIVELDCVGKKLTDLKGIENLTNLKYLEYWEDAKEYTLTDFNHRFAALKEMGKKYIMIEEV